MGTCTVRPLSALRPAATFPLHRFHYWLLTLSPFYPDVKVKPIFLPHLFFSNNPDSNLSCCIFIPQMVLCRLICEKIILCPVFENIWHNFKSFWKTKNFFVNFLWICYQVLPRILGLLPPANWQKAAKSVYISWDTATNCEKSSTKVFLHPLKPLRRSRFSFLNFE